MNSQSARTPVFAAVVAVLSIGLRGFASAAEPDQASRKPNIVIIVADDLGYGDVQCYNPERGKIPTPNIDRLAAEGMRFTNAHASSSMCTPSRYSLLTGRYPWRTRLQAGVFYPWAKPLIAPDRLTIAGLARQEGYRTACIGKWHLGFEWPIKPEQEKFLATDQKNAVATPEHQAVWREIFSQPIGGGPLACGFESFFGVDMPHMRPYCFIENNRTKGIPSEFLPEAMLGGHLGDGQGPAMSGWNFEQIMPVLGDRAVEFIADHARSHEPFFLYLPMTTPHTPWVILDEGKGKSGMPSIFADLVVQTDDMVGRVVEEVEKSGAADDTLVILTSDNGPPWSSKGLQKYGHHSGGPLRGYKSTAWEGGHRMPFIVRWPKVVKPGGMCGQLIQQADLIATFAAIFGVTLPDDAGVDSFNILPLLEGGQAPVRESSVSCGGARGTPTIQQGDWKLILNSPEPAKGTPAGPELYNLADDLGETKNLATEQPARVEAMKASLEKIIDDGRSTPGALQNNDGTVKRTYTKAAKRPAAENASIRLGSHGALKADAAE